MLKEQRTVSLGLIRTRRRKLNTGSSTAPVVFESGRSSITAIGLLGYPVYTNFYQSRVQRKLEKQIASPEHVERYKARTLEDE